MYLQTFNPGKETFLIPYYVDIPWWIAGPFLVILIVLSITVYLQIKRKKKGFSKGDFELNALKELVGYKVKQKNRMKKGDN